MKNLEGLYREFSNFESTDYEVVFESFPTNVITRFLTGKRTYLKYYIRRVSSLKDGNLILTYNTDSSNWGFRDIARWGFSYGEKIFYWQNSDDAISIIMTAKTRQGADTSKDTVVFSTKDLSSLP
jgi:hypothetical protein